MLYLKFATTTTKAHLGIDIFFQSLQILNNFRNHGGQRGRGAPTLPFLQCDSAFNSVAWTSFSLRGARSWTWKRAAEGSGFWVHECLGGKGERRRAFECEGPRRGHGWLAACVQCHYSLSLPFCTWTKFAIVFFYLFIYKFYFNFKNKWWFLLGMGNQTENPRNWAKIGLVWSSFFFFFFLNFGLKIGSD